MFVRVLLLTIGCVVFSGDLCAFSSQRYRNIETVKDTTEVRKLLSAALELITKGDFNQANAKNDSARIISESIGFDEGIVLSNSNRIDIFLVQRLPDSALTIIQGTLNEFPETKHLLRLYSYQATAFDQKGWSAQAIESYQKGLTYIDRLPESQQNRSRAATLVNMATAYSKLGDRGNAIKNYLLGLEFAEATKDSSFLAILLNNLGDTYNTYAEYDKAEYYLKRALLISQEKDFRPNLLRVYLNMANVYTNQEKYDMALDHYNIALGLHKELRPNTPPFQIIYNLGELYSKQNEFEKAKAAFEESLQYCIDLNIPQGLFFNYRGLGELYYKFSRPSTAIFWLEKALTVAKELDQSFYIAELKERLYQIYKETGNTEKALDALEDFKLLSDSLKQMEIENALTNQENALELNRQTEINTLLEEKQIQQEKQLALRMWLIVAAIVVIFLILSLFYLVYKRNSERRKVHNILLEQKKELEDLNSTKDKFFAIVAHDLRSPLTSMQGILYLIKSGDFKIEEIQDLATDLDPVLQKNIDTMDNLLSWARDQMSGIKLNVKVMEVKEIIAELISKQLIRSEAKKIEIENKITKSVRVKADENAFKLIVRNLLINAIKFTPEKGKIIFKSSSADGTVRISITDTGVGIPDDLKKEVFTNKATSRIGTEGEIGNGFGLSISKEFALRMEGDLTFESKPHHGTTFELELPAE